MEKRVVLFGSLAVVIVAGLLLMFWRQRIMGPDAARQPGGLVAVNAQGTPVASFAPSLAEAKKPDSAAERQQNSAFQQSGGLLVSLQLDPYPPTMSKPTVFTVTLADVQGRAMNGAAISVDLTMPGMWMPPNKLDLQSAGTGIYAAEGHFTMRGLWRMEVIITLNGQTQSVFFDVWL